MKASSFNLAALGERMKASRELLGISQAAFCEQYGFDISIRSYQKNEAGLNEPGIGLAASFTVAGINANWLLTGEGPMLLAELMKQGSSVPGLDQDRMRMAIESTKEGLRAANREMDPSKEAELILAVYDLLEEPSISKERVLKLVKLAA